MRREEGGKDWQIEAVRALGLVLLATLVVRLYLFVYTPVIAQDATFYITQAQFMAQGAWREAVAGDFEPLFPFSIFVVQQIIPDWELAGKLASVIFGVLAIVPFFLISRDVFGPRIAFGAGILFALHPYFARNSAEALQESIYLFFFLMSLWLALKALKSDGMGLYFLCALAIVGTWLSRGEGIWLFPALFMFFGLRSLRGLRERKWGEAIPLLRFSLAFMAVIIPIYYGIQSANLSGVVLLKGFGWLRTVLEGTPGYLQVGLAPLPSGDVGGRLAGDLWEGFFQDLIQAFHPLLLFLTILPLLRRALRSQYREHFLLTSSIVLTYLGGVFVRWLALGPEMISHRFMIVVVAVALPWAAVTIEMASAQMKNSSWSERGLPLSKKRSGIGHRLPVSGNQWGMIILMAIALILAAKTVKPQRLDKLPIKEAGVWIASQELKDPLIMARDGRIAFYAMGRIFPIPDTLDKKPWQEQTQIVQKIIQKATSWDARFVFLRGGLDREAQPGVLASRAVEEIREWQSPYGNQYTLIRVKAREELGGRR